MMMTGRGQNSRPSALLIAIFLAAVSFSPVPTVAAVFAPKSFHQLVAEADQIFIGTVAETPSRQLSNGAIVTDVTFSDLEVLKGGTAAGQIALVVLGGTVGTLTMGVEGIPRFQIGVRYLVFSEGNGSVVFPVVGGPQGMFQIRADPSTGRELVLDASGKPIQESLMNEALLIPPVTLDTFAQAIRSRLNK